MSKLNLEAEFEIVANFLTEGHLYFFFTKPMHTGNVWTYLQNTSNISQMNDTFASFSGF